MERLASFVVAAAFMALILGWKGTAVAQDKCQRSDFEAVVDEAGSKLREINGKQKPNFQAKLRELREKRQWSDEEFREKALPFVQDEQITEFDDRIRQRLFEITNLGTPDADTTGEPDCALLEELRETLRDLVETLEAKWAHMFAKIDVALAE